MKPDELKILAALTKCSVIPENAYLSEENKVDNSFHIVHSGGLVVETTKKAPQQKNLRDASFYEDLKKPPSTLHMERVESYTKHDRDRSYKNFQNLTMQKTQKEITRLGPNQFCGAAYLDVGDIPHLGISICRKTYTCINNFKV
eukprot:UN34117